MAHRSRRVRATLAGLAAFAVAAFAGCGGGTSPAHVGGVNLGVALRLASCDDWANGTAEERLGTIAQIENYAGGPVGEGGHGNTLKISDAYKLFDGACSKGYARGFRLYKLYTRASAFTPPGT